MQSCFRVAGAARDRNLRGATRYRVKRLVSMPASLLKCISAVVILALIEPAQAEEIPTLDLDPVCRVPQERTSHAGETTQRVVDVCGGRQAFGETVMAQGLGGP